jgi:hypothetical protein
MAGGERPNLITESMMGKNVHRTSTAALSLLMVAIGLALIVQGIEGGHAGALVRLVLGALFAAAGSGRLYLLARGSRRT